MTAAATAEASSTAIRSALLRPEESSSTDNPPTFLCRFSLSTAPLHHGRGHRRRLVLAQARIRLQRRPPRLVHAPQHLPAPSRRGGRSRSRPRKDRDGRFAFP